MVLPIVDIRSGEVVAITHGTLQTAVECKADCSFFEQGKVKTRTVFFQGMADIGLVHGTSLIQRSQIFANIKKNMENGIYETFDFLETSLVDYRGLSLAHKCNA